MLRASCRFSPGVTAIDRDRRTIAVGSTTFTVPPVLSFATINVGTSVSVAYEDFDDVLMAVDLVRLASFR
jgi:hypothetical protein